MYLMEDFILWTLVADSEGLCIHSRCIAAY